MSEQDPAPMVVQQAGQVVLGDTALVVHRTLEDERSPYAVLRARRGDDVVELLARPGQELDVPGSGTVLVAEVRASTRELRGGVVLVRR